MENGIEKQQMDALSDALKEVMDIAKELQAATPAASPGFRYLEETRSNFQQEMARILSPLPGPAIEVIGAAVEYDDATAAEPPAEAEAPSESSEAA